MKDRTTIQVSEELRKELRILASKRDVNYQKLLSDMVSVFRELDRDRTIVSIPKNLANKANEIVKNSDFKTVSELVTFVMRLMFYEQARPEAKIKKRLEAMGYL